MYLARQMPIQKIDIVHTYLFQSPPQTHTTPKKKAHKISKYLIERISNLFIFNHKSVGRRHVCEFQNVYGFIIQ